MPTRRATAALLSASALILAGCGGASTTAERPPGPVSTLPSFDGAQATPTQPPGTQAPGPSQAGVLPDLVVEDVGARTRINLSTLTPSPEPILVWLWAPH
jgi:hypothetical protein